MKSIFAAFVLLSLSGLSAQAGTCPDDPLSPVTLSTASAAPGTNVGVFTKLTNCSLKKKRLEVTISSISDCGQETLIGSSLIPFKGGETKGLSIAYPVSPSTCLGPLEVIVRASDRGETLEIESATLLVQ